MKVDIDEGLRNIWSSITPASISIVMGPYPPGYMDMLVFKLASFAAAGRRPFTHWFTWLKAIQRSAWFSIPVLPADGAPSTIL